MTNEQIIKGLTKMLNDTIEANECELSNNDFKDDIKLLKSALSLIKENQVEIELYKEELDSIYKALDIERGVARPRTDEIIRALKNTIKSQAKQIDSMTEELWGEFYLTYMNGYGINSKEELKQYFERKVEDGD